MGGRPGRLPIFLPVADFSLPRKKGKNPPGLYNKKRPPSHSQKPSALPLQTAALPSSSRSTLLRQKMAAGHPGSSAAQPNKKRRPLRAA